MKTILGVAFVSFAFASLAQAVVLHDQPLDGWDAGWCSSCQIEPYRQFGSFSLAHDSIIESGSFAIYDPVPEENDLNFTIWDEPFGNLLHSLDVPQGAYTTTPNAETYYRAYVNFPAWQLDAGDYWISMFSNSHLGWGTDFRRSDDRQYELTGEINNPNNYVGFSLSGTIVPEPSTGAMLMLAGILACRRHRNPPKSTLPLVVPATDGWG